ncbi:MAG: hypothetical protein SVW02_02180 [Candidatus Nanohaloarchaea archaeon]|nr:hypothetical protein [Candidatus Nanohaloarchaea archaeon]
MDPRRREALKLTGYAGGALIGIKGLSEAGSEIRDLLNGECDNKTDSISLGPGDAVVYRQGNQTYYLEHSDETVTTEARFGPINAEKETVELGYNDQEKVNGGQLRQGDRDIPLYVHINIGDVITGGDVVEPRGVLGISPNTVRAEYPKDVCVIEHGEASEMRPDY